MACIGLQNVPKRVFKRSCVTVKQNVTERMHIVHKLAKGMEERNRTGPERDRTYTKIKACFEKCGGT